ncbi:hypothetical protein M406DRAFT_246055 [Cryphonectria parasitica EP155]|uniref:Dienelactone hydrolase domain-containing protein n=1 Tax=Cryphonectria parasitica (strain ATCC 38755 / EP155) TaxID=660469 RepID=A0A9P5CTN5_CRYP1|nr:uncharacterized protein M406DRAFT_246055 [Cryphonectria parasitica EP155]KAF3769862.1 hypothetical protein M406DRAFT_246055 [Cryphonectria parasitica EP155]
MSCKDCEEIPPVSSQYSEKGRYETIAGFKTYVTGPADATRIVIEIYDVFGFASQTIQGADRLAEHLGNTLVVLPDLLEGKYVQHDWIPADTPEKQQLLQEFRSGPGNISTAVESLLRVRAAVGKKYPAVERHVAVGGLCWGGKVAVKVSGEGNEGQGRRFEVAWTAHPGGLDVEDTKAMNVPYICLASPGEDADTVAKVKQIVETPPRVGYVETFGPPMFHGWMGARANLDDELNRREFERGYQTVARWLNKFI